MPSLPAKPVIAVPAIKRVAVLTPVEVVVAAETHDQIGAGVANDDIVPDRGARHIAAEDVLDAGVTAERQVELAGLIDRRNVELRINAWTIPNRLIS